MANRLLILPLMEGLLPDGPLPSVSGSCTYPVIHEESGTRLFVKRISVPESSAATDALLLRGVITDKAAANEYYLREVNRIRGELSVLASLSKTPNICGFLRYQVAEKEDTFGYDIYLLSRRRLCLKEMLADGSFTSEQGIKLASDLCSALTEIRNAGYLYRCLKPENIFYDNGRFCIGDLGLSPVEASASDTILIPRKNTPFTAPELCSSSPAVSSSSDIYSLGMLLYYIYNGNHLPFRDSDTSAAAGERRRLMGEPLPFPMYADYDMGRTILKACAFRPEDRYKSPDDLLSAISALQQDSETSAEPIVPPIISELPVHEIEAHEGLLPEDEEESPFEEEYPDDAEEDSSFLGARILSDDFKENFAPRKSADSKRRVCAGLIAVLLLIFLLLGAAGGAYYYFVYSAVNVDGITVSARGVDYLTVSIESDHTELLMVTCSNEDGTYKQTFWGNSTQTFTGLKSSTMYDITVSSLDWHHLKGNLYYSAATNGYTEITDFVVHDNNDGSALVTFRVGGPEPDIWTLVCSDDSGAQTEYPVQDHNITVYNLLPNVNYTFSLMLEGGSGYGYYLKNFPSTTLKREVSVDSTDFTAEFDGTDRINVSWAVTSDFETEWTLTCSGSNGYSQSVTTSLHQATFEGITPNSDYTISLKNPTTDRYDIASVHITAGLLSGLKAAETDECVHISWNFENPDLNLHWIVSVRCDSFDYSQEFTTENQYADIYHLVPSSSFTVTISTEEKANIDGNTELQFRTASADEYSEHTLGGIYTSLWEYPGEGWSTTSLKTATHTHLPGHKFVFLMEIGNTPQPRDDEKVFVQMIIRNSSGNPVYWDDYSTTWTNLWHGKLFAMEGIAPETAGDYSVEIYFNKALVTKDRLTVS